MDKELINKSLLYVKDLINKINGLRYHTYNHTIEVKDRVIYLGEKEGLNDNKIEILILSAIFHDTGFSEVYDNNEENGAKIAKLFLEKNNYNKSNIDIIQKNILSTHHNYINPKNIYEKIIKDADMDNIGRDDFFEKGKNIKDEIKNIKKEEIKDVDWYIFTLKYIENHTFFTNTSKKERNSKKEENIEKLKNIIKNLT